jgi:hypothetical protein
MKRVASWVAGILVAVGVLASTAHAATSEAAHAAGGCLACNLHECLMAMFH